MSTTVAALYVDNAGPYVRMVGVECWFGGLFDARRYAGPHPVVAHPPCQRWCKLARFVAARHSHCAVGDDGGLFAHALATVRRFGGVLEHPAWSLAWPAHGLTEPPRDRTWLQCSAREWVCEVHQVAYGHRAQKKTWLLYVGSSAPAPVDRASPEPRAVVGHARKRGDGTWWRKTVERMGKRERKLTPPAFARFLVELARGSVAEVRHV